MGPLSIMFEVFFYKNKRGTPMNLKLEYIAKSITYKVYDILLHGTRLGKINICCIKTVL
ncbi:hypothetical protein BD408DRAFT_425277 [Parasitella parasitica]|nr:hypothetical protein BD408DRAFT_425277 [Parasitella parasitica]